MVNQYQTISVPVVPLAHSKFRPLSAVTITVGLDICIIKFDKTLLAHMMFSEMDNNVA